MNSDNGNSHNETDTIAAGQSDNSVLSAGNSGGEPFRLPSIFSDHMVLQQNAENAIWGWGSDGEIVNVDFSGQQHVTTIKEGRWKIRLKPVSAGGPYEMKVRCNKSETVISNILVGEVWVCSGQSNMQVTLSSFMDINREEIADSYDPGLRQFFQRVNGTLEMAEDVDGGVWKASSPDTSGAFSAVAYYFGKELRKKLGVPVGLISAAVGGTRIQEWMSSEIPGMKDIYVKDYVNDENKKYCRPSTLYNKMIAPLQSYTIKGVIWYQGESNAVRSDPYLYADEFRDMVVNWRKGWNIGRFPFLFVQLPGYKTVKDEEWSVIRDEQLKACQSVDNTYMVTTVDIGERDNIHPRNKKDVGLRLSLAALAGAYNEKTEYSGPIIKSAVLKEGKVILKFDHCKSGLAAGENGLVGFEISGSDGVWLKAAAEITGEDIVTVRKDMNHGDITISGSIQSEKIRPAMSCNDIAGEITGIRYAWRSWPEIGLYNKERLPASPFRIRSNRQEGEKKHTYCYDRRYTGEE